MTFNSVYEMFSPLTIAKPQRFWDWFSGDDLKSYWNKTLTGSGTVTIDDTVDGGALISASATSGGNATINFNQKRQYAHDGSIVIMVLKINNTTANSDSTYAGLSSVNTLGSGDVAALHQATQTSSNWFLSTLLSGTETSTDTSTTATVDTYFNFKTVLDASNVELFINSVTSATNTTNLPAIALQPLVGRQTNTNNLKTINLKYYEVFNT